MPNKDTTTDSATKLLSTSQGTEVKRAFYSKEEKPAGLFSTLPYYSIIGLYALVYWLVVICHQPWTACFIVFVFLPLSDYVFPEDWLNPTPVQYKKLDDDFYFRIPLFLSVAVEWIYYFVFIKHLCNEPFDLIYWSGALFITGTLVATNFMAAHELFHKHDALGRWVGGLTITKMLYTHFFIEHQYGHHKWVATPHDPATSRFGEPLYHYLPRSIIGSFISAWNIEKRRLVEIEECSTHWHPKNRMIWYVLGYFAFPLAIYAYFGCAGMLVSLYLAFHSVFFLESINYLEHYGLERKEVSPGEYEKVNITHSWNAPHRITNYVLFKLQRHSDHHENGYKPYQTLATYDESPMLPNGYAFCILLSFCPPFWFKIINPYVTAHKKNTPLTPEEKAKIHATMVRFFGYAILVFGGLASLGFIFPHKSF